MAVAAARALAPAGPPDRAVLVSRQLDGLARGAEAVLGAALELDCAVELRRGGAAATLDALVSAPAGTIVIGVELGDGHGAAAARIGRGRELSGVERSRSALPIDEPAGVHDDARLYRDRGLRPAALELSSTSGLPVALAGPEPRAAAALNLATAVAPPPIAGAPAPMFALADLAGAGIAARLIALEAGGAVAIDLPALLGLAVARASRMAAVALPRAAGVGPEIPISLSAFERAFDAKVGLRAGRCAQCGELSFPPRPHCLACGSDAASAADQLVSLPRSGEVYSVVTIHAPVPGKATPYSLAVVSLAGTTIRVLAPVTDAEPGSTAIGASGELVLRRAAVRQGIPDYGYAFQPDENLGVPRR